MNVNLTTNVTNNTKIMMKPTYFRVKLRGMHHFLPLCLFAFLLLAISCNDYLDESPDNRTEVDTEDKIAKLITSANFNGSYLLINEYMSDNVDNLGDDNPYTTRFYDQVYNWEDVTETNNESPEELWQDCYSGIAAANQALESINALGNIDDQSVKVRECKAEALLCRAYNHFILVNEFAKNYNSATSSTDPGVTYMEKPETELIVNYKRNTVAEVYANIDRDIQEALPLVGDTHLDVPKYHFNTQAAYAFAAKFYLFYEKWDKSIEYATQALGTHPENMLRDWKYMSTMTQEDQAITEHYVDASLNANIMLGVNYSTMGLWNRGTTLGAKYSHDAYLAANEDIRAIQVFGSSANFYEGAKIYSGTNYDKVTLWKLPYYLEYTNAQRTTGYVHSVLPMFKSDLTLLERAEAYIMLKQYDNACADMNTWAQNFSSSVTEITPESAQTFFNRMNYATWNASTMKKHLNPAFTIDAEGSVQETMLQAVLSLKRLENLGEGQRWWDIKRYGIEIWRRTLDENGRPAKKTDDLTKDDLRRAIQIPQRVVSAGYEANPR